MNPPASQTSDIPPTGLSLRKDDLGVWREALAHLRHLSDDVWTGLKVFLGFNGFIIVSLVGVLAFSSATNFHGLIAGALSMGGILLTLAARYILKRQRIYYLQMLAKKSMLEEDLGFYRAKFTDSPTDFAFPWRVGPPVIAEMREDLDAWIAKSVRGPGTFAKFQFLIYEILIGGYCLSLFYSIAAIFR